MSNRLQNSIMTLKLPVCGRVDWGGGSTELSRHVPLSRHAPTQNVSLKQTSKITISELQSLGHAHKTEEGSVMNTELKAK